MTLKNIHATNINALKILEILTLRFSVFFLDSNIFWNNGQIFKKKVFPECMGQGLTRNKDFHVKPRFFFFRVSLLRYL